jgi:alkanesulfonate monooxygenase SsuD/methylene tetrahydromethanopterin reductase-like flavin-dependent oxidoreductase (luciferase family)
MRRLWTSGSYMDFHGRYFDAEQIFLYTKPRGDIKVLMASIGEKSAGLAGEHGDGIITLSSRNPIERIRDVVFASFDAGARRAKKDPSKMEKVVSVSFTLDDLPTVLQRPRGPSGNLAKGALDEPDPRKIEQMGEALPDDALVKSRVFCSSWSDVAELIWKFKGVGATQVVLPAGPDKALLRLYAEKLLPLLDA